MILQRCLAEDKCTCLMAGELVTAVLENRCRYSYNLRGRKSLSPRNSIMRNGDHRNFVAVIILVHVSAPVPKECFQSYGVSAYISDVGFPSVCCDYHSQESD